MRTNKVLLAVAILLAAFAAAPAGAAILFQNIGTGAPPATLGAVTMIPFAQLPTAGCYDNYTTIPGNPIPGDLTVAPAIGQTKVGVCWASWSHGYTGDIYYSNGATSVTLTMPPGTAAFYFYVEPNPFSWFDVTATTDGGTTSGAIPVNGQSGANGFGFYTDGADTLATITISSAVDFAVGEFGIGINPFDLSYADDYGRSRLCVNSSTGAYRFTVLKGTTAGVYNGTCTITSIPPYRYFTDSTLLKAQAETRRNSASGSYKPAGSLISTPLLDSNTTNNGPCQ